ncbi:MAG: ankyrin repeat domain-containing protein [Bryobacterales bacterium]|nr:ankyrin repeat domain-containing protein [Bryobacterales bacterium]
MRRPIESAGLRVGQALACGGLQSANQAWRAEARRSLKAAPLLCCAVIASSLLLGASEVADAVARGDIDAARALIAKKADVNAAQVDGTTALHWAAQNDDLETADLLIKAGAKAMAANQAGATPLQLAAVNGSAKMIEKLAAAGADVNAPLTRSGDTALMIASRTGKVEAVRVLLDRGAQVNAKENWGGTTALMWAVSERHPEVAKLLIEHGADPNAKSNFVPAASGRGFEGTTPTAKNPGKPEEFASGLLTPLMFAAREGDLESARLLVAAGADPSAVGADGKDALSLAIFNGSYDVASFLVDNHAKVNQADAQRFTPLFWAVDRRNMETAPNFPWMVTADPMPLIKKLLDAGADPNAIINNTPRARMREGSPRIVFATAFMRAAFAGDIELVKLLLAHGANPHILSKDRESSLEAAAGTALINGYNRQRSPDERLAVVKLMVEMGEDVNWADSYGITPLMGAANLGDAAIVQYLIDKGADLGAYDLGKKNDGAFGSSIEPLMPIDYAIGVGTFVPNNAVIPHPDVIELMSKKMKELGIQHTTSECTLRGFTCAGANVDPKTATPAEIVKIRKIQTGYQVDGITGGLSVKEGEKDSAEKDGAKPNK